MRRQAPFGDAYLRTRVEAATQLRPRSSTAHERGQAYMSHALVPQRLFAPRGSLNADFDRRYAFEDFAVVTGCLRWREPSIPCRGREFACIFRGARDALNHRILISTSSLVNIGLRHAVLFDSGRPWMTHLTIANHRRHRGGTIGPSGGSFEISCGRIVVVRVLRFLVANRRETRCVGGVSHAATREVRRRWRLQLSQTPPV